MWKDTRRNEASSADEASSAKSHLYRGLELHTDFAVVFCELGRVGSEPLWILIDLLRICSWSAPVVGNTCVASCVNWLSG